MDTKYIFVTGGVVSSLGKGIISASIGKLLQTVISLKKEVPSPASSRRGVPHLVRLYLQPETKDQVCLL